MRCHLTRRGHIYAVEILVASSDNEAVEQSLALLRDSGDGFDGFEIWDGDRMVRRFPGDDDLSTQLGHRRFDRCDPDMPADASGSD
jgi:hypothetical protein